MLAPSAKFSPPGSNV